MREVSAEKQDKPNIMQIYIILLIWLGSICLTNIILKTG